MRLLPLLWLLPLALLMASAASRAKEAAPAAEDPVLEKRVTALSENLRCLVCQNQSIADSHADLAVDLKKQVREQMKAGASDQAIIDYMVQRYGEFVLYRPPVKLTTVLLWFGPFLLLVGALIFLWRQIRRRRDTLQGQAQLSEEERARARELLGDRAGPA
jgi:cytochrome c-type biogenesis protein CcmH